MSFFLYKEQLRTSSIEHMSSQTGFAEDIAKHHNRNMQGLLSRLDATTKPLFS